MFLSVFDIFKIGVGPSSSHTMGPMIAARRFVDGLEPSDAPLRVSVRLHGSLAFTGKGHATDRAVWFGLLGFEPETVEPENAEPALERLRSEKKIERAGGGALLHDPDVDLVFDYGPPLEAHPNAMTLRAQNCSGEVLSEAVYFSIGGGFVMTEAELAASFTAKAAAEGLERREQKYPYAFRNAARMLEMGRETGLSIAEMKRANELIDKDADALTASLARIRETMLGSIARGMTHRGVLPGGLKVTRRAAGVAEKLEALKGANSAQPHNATDWLSVYAMAVNEENAAGGRIVTAPTNGAAGVVPSVLKYMAEHCVGAPENCAETFLLTAAAIGGLIKHNASISGAELGCQAEIGSASAMAAAGLCAALGGSNEQIENAAEIALEHHLGLTCDPVGGLVQVPCIERNGFGAIKAVSAASLALHSDGAHLVSLDACIETMRQTGLDMSAKYKETSQGGLAVNLPAC